MMMMMLLLLLLVVVVVVGVGVGVGVGGDGDGDGDGDGGDDDDTRNVTVSTTATTTSTVKRSWTRLTQAAQDFADPQISHRGHPLHRRELQARAAATAMAILAALHSPDNMQLRGLKHVGSHTE